MLATKNYASQSINTVEVEKTALILLMILLPTWSPEDKGPDSCA